METFFASLAFCAGNSPAIGEIPAQRPATRRFDVFFDLRLNKQLSNTRDAGDLRRHGAHYDVIVMYFLFRKTRIYCMNCSLWYRVTIVFLLNKDSVILINQRGNKASRWVYNTIITVIIIIIDEYRETNPINQRGIFNKCKPRKSDRKSLYCAYILPHCINICFDMQRWLMNDLIRWSCLIFDQWSL